MTAILRGNFALWQCHDWIMMILAKIIIYKYFSCCTIIANLQYKSILLIPLINSRALKLLRNTGTRNFSVLVNAWLDCPQSAGSNKRHETCINSSERVPLNFSSKWRIRSRLHSGGAACDCWQVAKRHSYHLIPCGVIFLGEVPDFWFSYSSDKFLIYGAVF